LVSSSFAVAVAAAVAVADSILYDKINFNKMMGRERKRKNVYYGLVGMYLYTADEIIYYGF
jgi:hypothetical protein